MNNKGAARLEKKVFFNGLKKAMVEYGIVALTRKNDKVLFDFVHSIDNILHDFHPSVLSPKKFFFPKEEVILKYTREGKVSSTIEAKPAVLYGIRPCDLNAIKILDEAFSENHGDPNYLSKRENSIIIGLDCKSLCNQDAFCFKVGSEYADGIADIHLFDLGDDFAVLLQSSKGRDFMEKYNPAVRRQNRSFNKDTSLDVADHESYCMEKKAAFAKEGKTFAGLEKLPEIFEKNRDHPVWDEEGKKCLSCGSCIVVCPTCYCFDLQDELSMDLKKGERLRRWDACMLHGFAEIAGGENFRPTAVNRLKHRINRKFNYLMKKHGQSVCVGCGRCVRACLAEISPDKIAGRILNYPSEEPNSDSEK